jgi:hypothetical protein
MRGFFSLLAEALVRLALLLALVALAPRTAADTPRPSQGVFKCAGERGTPVYQGTPCPPGRELRDLLADPANVSVIDMHVREAAPASAVPRRERPARAPPPPSPAKARGDPAERRHAKAGMTEGEILAKLGAPDAASAKHGRHARWTYLPAPGDPQTVTTIRFEDGRVTAVERAVVR